MWEAFQELSSTRGSGFGPTPIRHVDILAYCVLHAVRDSETLCLVVMEMDRVWMKWAAEKDSGDPD